MNAPKLRPDRSDEAVAGDPDTAAAAYWIDHASQHTGAAAVHPRGRWLRYHAWTRRMLQTWTLDRVRDDRARYRRCVDLGCGPGDWASLFAQHADEIHACDVAPSFVAQTRERLAGHTAAHVEVADVRAYRIPRGADLVYLGGVMTYLSDDDSRELLARVRAAVAPGAHVIVRDYCTINLGRRRENTVTGYSVHRDPVELRAFGEAAGFRCLESRTSPGIYGEVLGGAVLGWPLRGLWRLATAHWMRASCTLRFRA